MNAQLNEHVRVWEGTDLRGETIFVVDHMIGANATGLGSFPTLEEATAALPGLVGEGLQVIFDTASGGWRPMDQAPKDGTWIIGFVEEGDPLYIAMRWFNGIFPDEDDDLSTDEVGEWVGPEGRTTDRVTAWLPFQPHPLAPPTTDSVDDYDGLHGVRHPSRAERGITEQEIADTRAWYAEHKAKQRAFYEDDDAGNDNDPTPSGGAAA